MVMNLSILSRLSKDVRCAHKQGSQMLSHTPVLQEKIDNYTSTYEEATRDQHYTIAEKSDVGRKRLENQDFMGHLVLPEGILAVVCDGMGNT